METKTKMITLTPILLERILDLGSMMLVAGGEVRRVEDTVTRLCKAYGGEKVDVFTITSCIVVTVRFTDRDPITEERRAKSQNLDLMRLDRLNALSREICASPMESEEFRRRLAEIKPTKKPFLLNAFAWALVSLSFSLFFGGNWVEAGCSAVIGAILCCVRAGCSRFLVNHYFSIILCSILGGALGQLPLLIGMEVSAFYINIGNIMLLISGIALTTAIRDMFSGDTISGLLRFAESVLVGMAIAWGFAVFDFITDTVSVTAHPFMQVLGALFGSVGFAITFKAKMRMKGFVGAFLGGIGWVVVILVMRLGGSEALGYLFAAILITLLAELFAKAMRTPTTVFLIIGTLPLIPGKALYQTMQYGVERMWDEFLEKGVDTVIYALAISVGIILVTTAWEAVQIYLQGRKKSFSKN